MSQSLSVVQSIVASVWVNFCLKATGSAANIEGFTLQESERVLKEKEVTDIIDEWGVSWGPVVSIGFFSSYAHNCMMVTKKKTNDVLSINIAGTTQSLYTRIVEDLNIACSTRWPYHKGINLDPRVSNGMMIGLDTLINMQGNCSNIKGKKCTLLDYLKEQVEENPAMEVRVCGLSLGGSLAVVLGLYLYENQVIWNPMGSAKLKVHCVAGFTVGNNDFRIYYEARLLENTIRTWNTLDITSYMFDQDLLYKIPSLYEPNICSNLFIESMVMILSFLSGFNGYCHVLEDAFPLIGQYHSSEEKEPKKVGFQSWYGDYEKFMEQCAYQHTHEYFVQLGIYNLWKFFPFGLNFFSPQDPELILNLVSSKMKISNNLMLTTDETKTKKKKKKTKSLNY